MPHSSDDSTDFLDLVAQAALDSYGDRLREPELINDIVARVIELRERKNLSKPAKHGGSGAISLRFEQGTAHAVALARVLALYAKGGIDINVACPVELEFLFAAAGAGITGVDELTVEIRVSAGSDFARDSSCDCRQFNNTGCLIGRLPLPALPEPIGSQWLKLASATIDCTDYLPAAALRKAARFVSGLTRPLILLNPMSSTGTSVSNLPREITVALYRQLLDICEGTLLIADWNAPVPRFGSWRVRPLSEEWATADPATLLALIQLCDLVVAIDGDVLQLTTLTNTPLVGVFPSPSAYPVRTCLPRATTVNIVPHDVCNKYNRQFRIAYNMVETPRGSISLWADTIADTAKRFLDKPKYLPQAEIGADIQLQQFVGDWERGYENTLSGYVDRHRGFDFLFQTIAERFAGPLIVETSVLGAWETWKIDGFATYLLGAYLQRLGGALVSVDASEDRIEFARSATMELSCVTLLHSEPASYLQTLDKNVDVLVVNGDDPFADDVAERALSLVRAAEARLHERSVVLIDDSPYFQGAYTGRGEKAVPWLLERNWRIAYSGYQTICVRGPG